MYKREFDNLLLNKLPKAVLFYGENEYFLDYYINYYIKALNLKDEALILDYDEYNFNNAFHYLSQSSLFGDINLLVIRSDKKIPKKELEALLDITNKSDINYFLYIYKGSAKDARSIQSTFNSKNGGLWVRFFEASIRDGMEILNPKSKELGLNIDNYSLQHLFILLNNNIALSVNELEKLAILNREITTKDIDNLVYSTSSIPLEGLMLDIFNKKNISKSLYKLLELGEDEFSILRAIQYFINQIFLFNTYIKLNGSVNSMEILGYRLPKHIEEQKANMAIKIDSKKLLKIYEYLLYSELELKEAKSINREPLIFAILIKIQSYL
ncbi:hypothetical protein MNB_SV-15-351 [hydrothermal vent metagenome]|uniref:Uncharacterized protein n=1 Tax=hydrothermal vent metagenome TaxID=652676 RepID=A0A1W1EIH0_9ZZZZ